MNNGKCWENKIVNYDMKNKIVTADKIWFTLKKNNPSSHLRSHPLRLDKHDPNQPYDFFELGE